MKDAFVSVSCQEKSPLWQQGIQRSSALYPRGNDIRSEFERDYTRILHSEAYRRLKHKTQIFFAPQNDHVCTRMEHVAHVTSVAATITKYLGLNQQLATAIALGHDIGHPPFAHAGEECLNSLLKQKEGKNAPKKFWHQRNGLFFADYIETLQDPEEQAKNLDLTYAVRDGILSHSSSGLSSSSRGDTYHASIVLPNGLKPRKEAIDLYEISQASSLQTFTWEGCVVKLANIIAYIGRDIEDARRYQILDMGAYRQLQEIVASCFGFTVGKTVNTTVLINDLIVDLCQQSSPETGLLFSPEYYKFIQELINFNASHIYNHWRLEEFKHYAFNIIKTIYRTLIQSYPFVQNRKTRLALKQYPRLSVSFENWLVKYTAYDPQQKERLRFSHIPAVFDISDRESYEKCVIEYISGMTDQFAIAVHGEIISF